MSSSITLEIDQQNNSFSLKKKSPNIKHRHKHTASCTETNIVLTYIVLADIMTDKNTVQTNIVNSDIMSFTEAYTVWKNKMH